MRSDLTEIPVRGASFQNLLNCFLNIKTPAPHGDFIFPASLHGAKWLVTRLSLRDLPEVSGVSPGGVLTVGACAGEAGSPLIQPFSFPSSA